MTELIKKKVRDRHKCPKIRSPIGENVRNSEELRQKARSGCGFERAIRSPRWIFGTEPVAREGKMSGNSKERGKM